MAINLKENLQVSPVKALLIPSQESLVSPLKRVLLSAPETETSSEFSSDEPFSLLSFPPEVCLHILQYIPCHGLCSLASVSRSLLQLATDPILWSSRGADISRTKMRLEGVEFLQFQRFEKLTSLDMQQVDLSSTQWTSLLTYTASSSSVKHLNLYFADLTSVSPDIIGQSVKNLITVNLGKALLTPEQSQAIITGITASSSLRNINLKYVDLGSIPPGLLSEAVCCLDTVDLENCQLSTDQSKKICEGINHSSTLHHLSLMFVCLLEVPSEALAGIVTTLHTINLAHTRMILDQLVPLLQAIHKSDTIREINLLGIDLSLVPCDVLTQAVGSLVKGNLTNTNLTTNQAEAVFKAIKSSKTLTSINLQGVNLSGISGSLLVETIGYLEHLNLSDTNLSQEQLELFLPALEKSTSSKLKDSSSVASPTASPKCVKTLRDLTLRRVDLSKLKPAIISGAVSKIKTLDIGYTNLDTDQIKDLLQSIAGSQKVKEINIQGVNLSKTSSDLLSQCLSHMEKVNVRDSCLSKEQITSLLHGVKQSTTMLELDLLGVDLMEIPSQLLLQSLDHLARVNISRNKINPQQRKALEKIRRRSQYC